MHPEFIPVWQQTTPELHAELVAFWTAHGAIADAEDAGRRAGQAVLVARDADGRLCGVGTAVLRVLPRLRQPLYYYRQFLAPEQRGQGVGAAFMRRARDVLQAWNSALASPESLGLLLEIENPMLARRLGAVQEGGLTFIGYSPRGLQLRVSYFEGARLLPPAPPARVPTSA